MIAPGDVLDEKYRIVRLIGEGGMGVVYEAEHLRLRNRCAIKMLLPAMMQRPEVVARFEREARAAGRLRGAHVARVLDVATSSTGMPYIVMELLEGRDLESELQASGPFSAEQIADWMLQACSALVEAHAAGIVHRDLKPANLFLANDADGTTLKVLDFGISKFVEDEGKLTTAGAPMGTALYMSPEQFQAVGDVDARSDVWSLGVMMFELLTGSPPWFGDLARLAVAIVTQPAPRLAGRVQAPSAFVELVEQMLERDPARRPQSVVEVMERLQPFAASKSVGSERAFQLAKRTKSPTSSPDLAIEVQRRSDPNGATHPALEVSTVGGRGQQRRVVAVVAIVTALAGVVALATFLFLSRGSARAPIAAASEARPEPPVASSAPAVALVPAAAAASASAVPLVSSSAAPVVAPRPHPAASASALPPKPKPTTPKPTTNPTMLHD